MSLVKWTFIGLLVLPAAEIVAFILVAALIGWLVGGGSFCRHLGRWACCCCDAPDAPISTACAPPSPATGIQAVHLETPGAGRHARWNPAGHFRVLSPTSLGAALFVPAVRRWAATKLAQTRARSAGADHATTHHRPRARRMAAKSRISERDRGTQAQATGRGRSAKRDILVRPEALC